MVLFYTLHTMPVLVCELVRGFADGSKAAAIMQKTGTLVPELLFHVLNSEQWTLLMRAAGTVWQRNTHSGNRKIPFIISLCSFSHYSAVKRVM